jgi:hypothetical protein
MKRLLILSGMLVSMLAAPALYAAEGDSHSKELDKFYMRIGGFIPLSSKTQIRADTDYFLSATVDTENTLGQGDPDVTGRIDAYWRYHPKHSLGFTYYNLKANGSQQLGGPLRWDEEYEFTGNVDSSLEQETIKVDYTYSFYRSEKVELGISGGLHVTSYDFSISGEATLYEDDLEIDTDVLAKTGVDVTAPLPVVGFKLNYNFTPNVRLLYKTDIFALRFDNFKGNLVDSSLLVEYKAWKHVGFGGGLNSVQLQAESDEDNGTVGFYNRVLGAQVYLTLHY